EITSGVNLNDIGLGFEGADYIFLLVSMFLSIVCALGICMILGAFAKNYKSAQTMTMPLSILAMIPAFIIMFSGWYGSAPIIQGILFVIPFSHPMIAMQALMYNDYTLVLSGIAYMAAFAVVTIAITVRLYNSDILITGLGQNKTYMKLTGKK
ncbi:MAG: ABC transporter permease, partial [Candidatus Methanomethylophilaceae archaeon]|nr:ABC transporter permease [Candidatus Methanomethylophilaceae archaeon]